MPSEDSRVDAVLEILRPRTEAFRSAVASALEEVRAWVEAHRKPHNGAPSGGHLGLGAFAAGRIDLDRFASLITPTGAVDAATLERVEAALAALGEVLSRGDGLFRVDAGGGRSLHDALDASLAFAGRAFGAARVVELCKSGRFRDAEHGSLHVSLPFGAWHAAERRIAPPQVVTLAGRDLVPGAIEEFLDGTIRIVLVVSGDCAPAPLARLVTPGTLVVQAGDPAGLEIVSRWDGPAVAALVPQGAARFVHDPEGGAEPRDRWTVESFPGEEKLRSIAGRSTTQQREELRLLSAASTGAPAGGDSSGAAAAPAPPPPGGPPAPDGAPRAAEPSDKLAAWLLANADLSGLE